jgi:hypothetical protein
MGRSMEVQGNPRPQDSQSNDKDRGSRFNLKMLWETGKVKSLGEPTPTTERTPQLHRLHPDYRTQPRKRLLRLANQAKLHSFRTKPVYMYGYLVPRNHEQALELDKTNGNTGQTLLIRN